MVDVGTLQKERKIHVADEEILLANKKGTLKIIYNNNSNIKINALIVHKS